MMRTESHPVREVTPASVEALFPELESRQAAALAHAARMVDLGKGGRVFSEGDPCASLDWLVSGSVELRKSAASGKDSILHVVTSGRFIDCSGMGGQEAWFFSATALNPCRIIRFPRGIMMETAAGSGRFAFRFIRSLAMRERMFVNKISVSQGKISVRRRVAGWLLHKSRIEGGLVLEDAVTREVLAGLLGLTRESLSRQLSRFAREGILRIERRKLVIIDEQALRMARDAG